MVPNLIKYPITIIFRETISAVVFQKLGDYSMPKTMVSLHLGGLWGNQLTPHQKWYRVEFSAYLDKLVCGFPVGVWYEPNFICIFSEMVPIEVLRNRSVVSQPAKGSNLKIWDSKIRKCKNIGMFESRKGDVYVLLQGFQWNGWGTIISIDFIFWEIIQLYFHFMGLSY